MESQIGKKNGFLIVKLRLLRQSTIIAEIFKASSYGAMALWLADQIYLVVKGDSLANEAIPATQKIKF